MAKILVVDDDRALSSILSEIITGMGFACTNAFSIAEAEGVAANAVFDIIFLDVWLPDGCGLELLPSLRRLPYAPEVIIITSAGDPDGAELAIKNGAWDYLEKPFTNDQIALQINRTLDYRSALRSRRSIALDRSKIIGGSQSMTGCLDVLAQAASGDSPVLITGETGTGKELFARAIHENSSRRDHGFIVVDCAALPEKLVESILFGYVRGAFTGADRDREGLVKQADGGTLFLDEIGELPLPFQKVFLRVLQERRFRPIGAKLEEHSDFRLVSATNRNLADMTSRDEFRSDLLYRIQALTINVPPLRQRLEDIRELTTHYISKFCERNGIAVKGVSPEFFDALVAYPWPGNVRELVNAIESAASTAGDAMLLVPKHLPERVRIHAARASVKRKQPAQDPAFKIAADFNRFPQLQELRDRVFSDVERQYLQGLITRSCGDIEKACRLSGLARARMYELLKKYGLSLRS